MVVADDRGRSRDKRGTMREREREREREWQLLGTIKVLYYYLGACKVLQAPFRRRCIVA